jgi:hypothetical protein
MIHTLPTRECNGSRENTVENSAKVLFSFFFFSFLPSQRREAAYKSAFEYERKRCIKIEKRTSLIERAHTT